MTTLDAPGRRAELHAGYRALRSAIPEQMKGFGGLHRAAMTDGALSTAEKELIALAIGIAQHCEDCIVLHTHDALDAGASVEQVRETIGVAIMMGGGPASTYAIRANEALEQFEAARSG